MFFQIKHRISDYSERKKCCEVDRNKLYLNTFKSETLRERERENKEEKKERWKYK